GTSALTRAAASETFAATSTAGQNLKSSVADMQSAQRSYNDATTDLRELSEQQSRVASLSASQATDISQLAYANYASAHGGGAAGWQAAEALFSQTGDADALARQRAAIGQAGIQYLEGIRPSTGIPEFDASSASIHSGLSSPSEVYASGLARMQSDPTGQYAIYASGVVGGNAAADTAQGLGIDLNAASERLAVRSSLVGAATIAIPNGNEAAIGLHGGGFDTVYGRDPGAMVEGDLSQGTHAESVGSPISALQGNLGRNGQEFGVGGSTVRDGGFADEKLSAQSGMSALGTAASRGHTGLGAPFRGHLVETR
ncbi:MAG: hypothetical protein WBF53_12810, partial [Litorimonas sp.]